MSTPLLEQISNIANLEYALQKALRGKRHKPSAKEFCSNVQENLLKIQRTLLDESWAPGPFTEFRIYEPKERVIAAAPFADRVVHHAILNICEPSFERFAITDSYACRKGKGLHLAVKQAFCFSHRGGWFLKLDIRKYFENVNHQTLIALLGKRFDDPGLLRLFIKIISVGGANGVGLPIGNLTSQHFANFYLSHLDHWIKDYKGNTRYVRYMDDFVIWSETRQTLQRLKQELTNWLRAVLQLELKPTAERLAPVGYGLPFLGFRILPDRIRMKPATVSRFHKKINGRSQAVVSGLLAPDVAARSILSLYGFTALANPIKYRQRLYEKLSL